MTVRTLDIQKLAKELDGLVNSDGEPEEFCDEDDKERITELQALETTLGSKLKDFENGPLIHQNDFQEYVRDDMTEQYPNLADAPFWAHINWQGLADDMESDWTLVEFEGETYLYHE